VLSENPWRLSGGFFWGVIELSYNQEEKKYSGLKGAFTEWLHHFKWHVYVWPAMGLVGFLLKDYVWPLVKNFDQPTKSQLGAYASTHPLRVAGFLLFLAGIGIVFKVWGRIKPILIREKRYAEMLEGVGLREFSYHNSDEQRHLDWKRCVDEITKTRPNVLCILGATGWETFGSPQSPMHELLKNYQGSVFILLLKPGSSGFKRRITELNKNEDLFKSQIDDSISYCKELVNRHKKSIEVRLYVDEPIWKMIFSDRYLWLQYYDPDDDVDNTPVYTLQTRDSTTASSLYYPLVRVFRRRWNDSTSEPIPLK
jgi:hypothetical protein